ncbi:MAG: hypothetical protein ACOZCO_02980 [Bacteroidota bacterium]
MNTIKALLPATLVFISSYSMAQEKLKATSINIFKNGTYFVAKEGNVNLTDKYCKIQAPSSPLLSTFWLTTTKDIDISRVDFRTDTIKTTRYARNMQELISANKGKKARITYNVNSTQTGNAKGTIENYMKESGIVKFKTAEGSTLYLNTNSIIEFYVDETSSDKLTSDSLARLAKITFSKSKPNADLRLSYMHTGMNWIPSYNVKIIDDKTLQIEMKALIENYSEEITDADLTLTVGAANFKYGTQIDPLALNYLSGGSTYNGYNNYNNNYNYQYSNALVAPMSEAVGDNVSGVAYNNYNTYTTSGEKTNDLYMYKLGKVSLPMNTKSLFNIFSVNAPYEDLYEVNIYDNINYASNRRITNNEEQLFDVFHSLRITNTSSYPFTTAPVFVQDKNMQPLGQDQVKYTATGAKVKVQIAKATDIRVNCLEEETGKVENAKTYNKNSYRKVMIKGTIKIENRQPKAAQVNVSKAVNGEIKTASNGGKINKSGQYNGINAYSDVEWNISVGANEEKTITYEYEVYVYSGY